MNHHTAVQSVSRPSFGFVLLLAYAFLLPVCGQETPQPGRQVAQSLALTRAQEKEIRYLLHLPRDYAKGGEKSWPLMIFLHGAGERGDDLNRVKVHGPPKLAPHREDWPFVLVSPQCPADQLWEDTAVLELLDHILRTEQVDSNRVYLTGLSMGGYGTWSLASKHPERFAAVAPICGGGNTIEILLASQKRRPYLETLGVWAFHGGKDTVVPVQESELMVNALKRQNCQDLKLTIYPEAGHDSWTESYNNPALYEWFLGHHR